MNRYLAPLLFMIAALFSSNLRAQHNLQIDDGNGHYITISTPLGLTSGYNWVLPLNPPPPNTAFTEGGILEGQTLRWNNTLGYYVPTSALLIQANGAMTLDPGEGNNITLTNIQTDNAAPLFLTVDESNHMRLRSLGSILAVTANEGLVYAEPNIKLGADNATTNPFISNRFVNLDNFTLSFTDNGGLATLLSLDGFTNTIVAGTDVLPDVNVTHTLGSETQRWRDLYLGPSSLYIGVGAADQSKLGYDNADEAAQMLTIDADDDESVDATIDESGRLAVKDGLESMGNTDLSFRTNGVVRARFISETDDATEGAFVPELNSVYDLGTPELRWREIYVSEGSLRIGSFQNGTKGSQNQQTVDEVTLSYSNGNLVIDKPVANFGSMVPNTDNVLELGSSTNRWAELWLGPNSLHIGTDTYEGSISYDPIAKEMKFNSNNTIGSSELKIDSVGNVIIPALGAGGLLKTNAGGQLAIATGGTDFESPLTFSNGLTRTVNNVVLGGTLTGATDINIGGYDFTFTRTTGKISIGAGAAPAELLSVGTGSAFQINNAGQIVAATGITSSGAVTFTGLGLGVVRSSSGGVLSSAPLSTNATLIGDGTTTPFGINLSNANSWTALQTFSNGASVSGGLTIPSGANPLNVNGSNGTADQVLTSQGSNSPQWKSITTLGITTGTGTANTVAMWSSATAIGDAPMTVSSGNVTFTGAISNATALTSAGTITFSGLATGIVHSTAGVLSSSPLDLAGGATEVSGQLGVINGGTGLASVTAQALLIGNGTSAMNELTIGTDGDILTVANGAPLWQSPSNVNITTGTGTTGNLTMWSSTNVLGDAPITVDDGMMTLFGAVQLDDLTIGVVHSDLNGELSSSLVDLSNEVTDVLPTNNGGTGLSTVGSDGDVLTVVAGAPAWQALSTGATLLGDGTSTPFDLNLGNANTWTATQTFSGLTIPAGTNPMNVNGSDGTADQVLTSQGANSPEWKSISTLGVLTGTGASNKLAYWNGTSTLTNDADLGYDGSTLSMAGATGNISVGQSTNGGTNVRINIKDGHIRSQQTTAPTTAINANAGNAGAITLANATDVAGKITINTQGAGIAAGTQATITFNAPYNVAPIVVLTPANAKATTIQAYVTSTTTDFSVSFNIAGANNDDHDFYYHVIETQ